MKKIVTVDESGFTLTCEAGCVLQALSNYLAPMGLIVPLVSSIHFICDFKAPCNISDHVIPTILNV